MDGISDQLAGLSPKKQMLFRLLVQEKEQQAEIWRTIPHAALADSYPLSFAQERLWFLDQLEPSQSFYNMPLAVRLRGGLNVPALERSIREVTVRHEVLRATFISRNGRPAQVINPVSTTGFPLADLRRLPAQEREQRAREIVHEEAQQPFDLAFGRPIRMKLLRLASDDHVLVITMHHIVSDGWSIGVLMSEVAQLYDAFSRHLPSHLGKLPIQYTDFAVWQRAWLQGEVLEKQLSYWRQLLGGKLKDLELAMQPSQVPHSLHAERGYVEWPDSVVKQIKSLCRNEGVTLFMILLAGFQTWLHRYSGQDQIVVGVPTAGRNRKELEPLIGCFVNTLVMQSDLSGNPTFRELLARVKKVVLGAFAHQDVPLEKVVKVLQSQRGPYNTPIFRVLFVLQNSPLPSLELRGVAVSPVWVGADTSNFDLMLSMQEENGGLLTGNLRYNQNLFSAEVIAAMLEHFQVLMKGVASNPEWRLLDVPLDPLDHSTSFDAGTKFRAERDAEQQFHF